MERSYKIALILEKVFTEVNNPTWAMLEQFLTAHQIDYENGKPKVVHVDMDNPEMAIVYLAVHDQDFYYGMWVETKDEIRLHWMNTRPKIRVYFCAESETLTIEEMMALTSIDTQVARRKGELRWTKVAYKDSAIIIEITPEPRSFEDKLVRLLDHLEQDREGIKTLADKTETSICADCLYYSGHYSLGTLLIDKKIAKRIAALNLALYIDLEAWGEPPLEEPKAEEVLKKLKEKDLRELEERKKPTNMQEPK
jgi:hypothetical protein